MLVGPLRFFSAAVLLFAVALLAPRSARADGDPHALDAVLRRLELHAAAFEQMKARASYTLDGKLERLDGDGHVSGTKEMTVKVSPDPAGARPAAELVRYVEDGRDKTNEERARRGNGRMSAGKVSRLRMPFLAGERSRYDFSVAERDVRDPSRMRIVFVPRVPADDTVRGSAWVDSRAGEVLTLKLTPTKKPRFCDQLDVTVYFETPTSLGRAPSKVTFEAAGGLLFIRKRYRGAATISNASIS